MMFQIIAEIYYKNSKNGFVINLLFFGLIFANKYFILSYNVYTFAKLVFLKLANEEVIEHIIFYGSYCWVIGAGLQQQYFYF